MTEHSEGDVYDRFWLVNQRRTLIMGMLVYFLTVGVFGSGWYLGYRAGYAAAEASITPSNNYEYGHPLYWD